MHHPHALTCVQRKWRNCTIHKQPSQFQDRKCSRRHMSQGRYPPSLLTSSWRPHTRATRAGFSGTRRGAAAPVQEGEGYGCRSRRNSASERFQPSQWVIIDPMEDDTQTRQTSDNKNKQKKTSEITEVDWIRVEHRKCTCVKKRADGTTFASAHRALDCKKHEKLGIKSAKRASR